MWRLPDDDTKPVITAREHIRSAHRGCAMRLPDAAVVFFMGGGIEYLTEAYPARKLPESLPSFLNRRPVWVMDDPPVCLLYGGAGAPQAADTVETLAALGVKAILGVGMFGAFAAPIAPGEILAPGKAFVEEGTSLHYYESIEASAPDPEMHGTVSSLLGARAFPIVSTDAVYRQTYRKERLWREKGAVGVDMETSAVFSVSRCLGVRAAAILMASDVHPLRPDAPKWEWRMTGDMRRALADQSLAAIRPVAAEYSSAPAGV